MSAGGVVYRFNSENLQVLICGRDNSNLWALPKGTPEAGENIIDTALREVNEETGIKTVLENLIGSIGYNFSEFKFNVINQKIYLIPNAEVKHAAGGFYKNNTINEINICKNWHFMWSKFYFNRKYKGLIYAYIITFPFMIRSLIKSFFYFFINYFTLKW